MPLGAPGQPNTSARGSPDASGPCCSECGSSSPLPRFQGVVSQIDYPGRKLFVGMTKDQIKSAPDYDEQMRPEDEAYYDKYASYYGRYGF